MGDFFNGILNLIYIPLGLVFKGLYLLVQNYGLAIIVFAVVTKIAMVPLGIKNEVTRRKTMKIQPQLQELQKKYKNNTSDPKYNEEMQALYAKNGTSMYGGCGWTFLQLPIIWAIWNAIRNPVKYIWDIASDSTIAAIATRLFNAGVDLGVKVTSGQAVATAISTWLASHQITLAGAVSNNMDLVKDLLPAGDVKPINMWFLGLDLGELPTLQSWTLLIPVVSGLTSFLVGFISQKVMVDANKDPAAVQAKKSMNSLLYIMPIVSVWIGFTFNIAVGLYWIVSNLLSIAQTFFVKWYCDRKDAKAAPAPKPKKEKKLNYNQIAKMEREQAQANNKEE